MDNYRQLWIQRDLNNLAATRAMEQIERTGRALPCQVTAVDGAIVTVTFEANVPYTQDDGTIATFTLPPLTLPKAESQWLRAPTQVGDFGMTVPADTFLGGISGLGDGVADLSVDYGNMTTLVWVPCGAKDFTEAPDPNRAWVNGPNGVDVTDSSLANGVVIDKETGTVTIYAGSQTIVITSDPSITSSVTAAGGDVQTVIDGPTKAISHIVPSGGHIGLGELAASIPSTGALFRNTDMSAFQSSLLSARLDDLTKFAAAMVSAGVPNAGAVLGLLASLVPISVPAGSAITRTL